MKANNNNFGSRYLWSSVALTMVMSVAACSKGSSGDDSDGSGSTGGVTSTGSSSGASTDVPADSTGTSGAVSLSLATLGSSASALMLQGATSLDVGGGIVLTDARLSIASIKIKANKVEDEDEVSGEKTIESEKDALEEAMKADKEALEQQKEDIKATYEPQFEAATTDEAKDLLEDQMEAEVGAVELQMAALEGGIDDQIAALEASLDGNLKWKGPYVYDLVNKAVSPEIPAVDLVDGSYRRIEFKIKPNRTLEGTDPLLNNSVYVAGTVDIAGTPTPFTVSLRIDEEFKLMGTNAFKVDPAVANSLTVAFDPTVWFAGVDLSTGVADASGTIVIDNVSNEGLFASIRKNLKASTKFGEDEDGDGELGADEEDGDGEEGVAEEEAKEAEAAESSSDEVQVQ